MQQKVPIRFAEYQSPRKPGFKDRPGVIRCPCLPAHRFRQYLLQRKKKKRKQHSVWPPASTPQIKTALRTGTHANAHKLTITYLY